jgi:prohibitin 1
MTRHMRIFFRHMRRSLGPIGLLILLLLIMLGVVVGPSAIHFVQPGFSAVRWKRFNGGTQLDNPVGEGIILTYPWDRLTFYDTRIQMKKFVVDVLMQDGLTISVDLSVRYHLNSHRLGYLQRQVGPYFFETMIEPHTAAEARNVLALYTADTVYSADRRSLQTRIATGISDAIKRDLTTAGLEFTDLIVIDEALFLSIRLPSSIADAIERKNIERQRVERLEYEIQAEDQERKRKIVEANGIRSYQEIIKSNLTDQFLKWKGIEATLLLAKSNNAKTIMFGNRGSGLPLIFGGDDATKSQGVTPEKVDP